MDYEALARKFGGRPAEADDLEELARKFGGKVEGGGLSGMEASQALATGFNRSALTQLPGLPVKTALDVADLARAAYGYVGSKAGMRPDQMPEPLDRSQYVGSPEWIAGKIGATNAGASLIRNPRPDSPAARLLNAGGGAVGAAMRASPQDIAMQFASGVTGQAASEAGASPEWAMVAGMAPQVAVTGAAGATRTAIRGGDEGRRQMQERIRDFQSAGVDPTVGLATGGRGAQAIESMLAKVPGGAGVMARKVEAMQAQMQGAANAARDAASPNYGPASAGDAIKQGITDYRAAQQGLYGRMQDRALRMVPEDMRFPVDSIIARGSATLKDVPGAPNVSRAINEPLGFTQRVIGALETDAAPRGPAMAPSAILQESGAPYMREIPGSPGGLPFAGIKDLKSRIGQVAYQDNPLLADANAGAMKSLYGGAKQDLSRAGQLADAERIARGQVPGVSAQLQRADRFYAKTQDVLEKILAPLYKAGDSASERSYYRMEGDLRNSGQGTLKAMASLPKDARQQVTATAIDRLGKASPGQQNAEGSMFSPGTFLTNWNRLSPDGKQSLFLFPGGKDIRTKLDGIARSAEMMREANKVYANPSGTAQATNVAGVATGLASGALGIAGGNPATGLATMGTILGSMAAANAGARLMANPKFVTWLSQSTNVPPGRMRQHLQRLAMNAGAERDPEAKANLLDFVESLSGELSAMDR